MKKAAIVVVALFFFVIGLWFVALPESLIADLMKKVPLNDCCSLDAEGLKKGFFYNFSADKILIRRDGNGKKADDPIFVCNNVKGGLNLLSIAELSPELDFSCDENGGVVSGSLGIRGSDLKISANRVPVRGIPFLEPLGIRGAGNLTGSLWLRNRSGELKFSLTDAILERSVFGGVFLPLDLFREIKGAVSIKGDTVEMTSVTLSGTGVYARARGEVRGTDLNMTMELMTDSSFKQDSLLALLERYKISPGYYIIPVKGEIQQNKEG